MKKSSVNTFTEGLVCDLDPINVPNNVLTDCLNGTIITYDGNEFSLQNDKGNYPLKDCKLNPGFIPVGIKEHGGILYIVSLNPLTGKEEIGSYPSPKLYDGGTPHGDLNVEYVIDKAFEEANSEELDYSDLESECKSWYYADSELKLNVGDKFWFDEELENTNFEKIEKYIIDENSIPHLVSNDWLNKSLEYTSPISGTMMLKNKIFEIANSSAETNTFTCWANDNDSNNNEFNNSDYQFVTNENLIGEACIIYNNNGTWLSIQNPSDSNMSAITSEYNNYNSFVMNFYQDSNNNYYIMANGYYLQYDPNSSTGLSFTSDRSLSVYWSIAINNSYTRISPVSKLEYSLSYHDNNINCDGFSAGSIKLIRMNDSNSTSDSYEDDELLNNITSLFSFTHKLYIDDDDTLQWLTNDYLKYKVNIKVNDSIIYSDTFDGNSLISDSKRSGEYEIAIESRQATNLEWYSNNKIIAKYFVTVIKNIDSNDQISAEIIPIVSISDTKNIIMSQFAKPLNNSVSEYTSTTWTIGEEYYRFYNHPIDNEYTTQYIELDIKGPIEASDDFALSCEICDYDTGTKIETYDFTPGIGKAILQIDYNNLVKKEDAYKVNYSIVLAGTSIRSIQKNLITSELFNYDEFLEYKDYTNIDFQLIIDKYSESITINSELMFISDESDLPKSRYNYINGGDDIFDNYPNSLTRNFVKNLPNDYYIERLCGKICKYELNYNISRLEGPLWQISEEMSYQDSLGKTTELSDNYCYVPIGWRQNLKYSSKSKKFGHISNYLDNESEEIPTYELSAKMVDYKPSLYYGDKLVMQLDGLPYYNLDWIPESMFKFNISTADNVMLEFNESTMNYFAGNTGILMRSEIDRWKVFNGTGGYTGGEQQPSVYLVSGNILYISKIDKSFYNGSFIVIDDVDSEKKIDNTINISIQFHLNSKLGNYVFNKTVNSEANHEEIVNNLDSEFIEGLCQSGWKFATNFSDKYPLVINGNIADYYLDSKPISSPFTIENNIVKARFVYYCDADYNCTDPERDYVTKSIHLSYPNQNFMAPLIFYVKA